MFLFDTKCFWILGEKKDVPDWNKKSKSRRILSQSMPSGLDDGSLDIKVEKKKTASKVDHYIYGLSN